MQPLMPPPNIIKIILFLILKSVGKYSVFIME
jgi:hypothetical protein